ncbi:MAG TPA: hypothetical protein VKT77_03480 [Chthonomonadaceae bacterium]|nr:hypothetical protein [Chthonomonadaceae bacterium]
MDNAGNFSTGGALPQICLGSLSVSRMIAGSNPISGFSHSSSERSRRMLEYFTVDAIKAHLRACEEHGVNALVARSDRFVMRILAEYWREGGRIRWIAQTAPEIKDPLANIRQAHQAGASAIFIHGGDVDRLYKEGAAEEIRARVEQIVSLGLPAGVAAHEPLNLLDIQERGIPVDFYLVCMYNLTGYRGSSAEPREEFAYSDRALALAALLQLRKPCVAYKVLGAGLLSLRDGLADVRKVLRKGDGVLVGMYPPDCEDIVGKNVRAIAEL